MAFDGNRTKRLASRLLTNHAGNAIEEGLVMEEADASQEDQNSIYMRAERDAQKMRMAVSVRGSKRKDGKLVTLTDQVEEEKAQQQAQMQDGGGGVGGFQ